MILRRLLFNHRGATAAEFALVLPLFLILLFGIIDAGRFLWACNQAEKATQVGVRHAVATRLVPEGLIDFSFATTTDADLKSPQGDPVPTSKWGGVTCDDADCTNNGAGPDPGYSEEAFDAVVDRMQLLYPPIVADNVRIDYENVGLGFAGDPNGPDVAPLVRVRLVNLTFRPILFLLWSGTLAMPDFASALTMEDGDGTIAN